MGNSLQWDEGPSLKAGLVVVEVVVGYGGRAVLALLAQPQTCDSLASGNHHGEQ